MAAYEYDSKDCQLIIGSIDMSSFGDNKITITRNNDVTVLMEGVDGDNLFASSNRTAGTIAFDLIYGTDYDLYMDNLANYKGLVPITFTHSKGLKNLSTFGKVMSQADITLGETPEFRTWTLVVDSVDMSVNGQIGEFFETVNQNYSPS